MALESAKQALPKYSPGPSRHDFTQAQLFAILVLKAFFKTDYRGIVGILVDLSDLRRVLGISKVPNHSTLCYAEERLLKKGPSDYFSAPFLIEPGIWDLLDSYYKTRPQEQSPQNEWEEMAELLIRVA